MKTIRDVIDLVKYATTVEEIDQYRERIATIIPTISIMFDYDQSHIDHPYDLWMHTLHVLVNIDKGLDEMLYMGALLHDIGKPSCRIDPTETDPCAHYFGHPKKSFEIVRDEIVPLLVDVVFEEDIDRLLFYVLNHDEHIHLDKESVLKYTKDVDFETYCNLLRLEIADAYAHNEVEGQLLRIKNCTIMLNGLAKEITL